MKINDIIAYDIDNYDKYSIGGLFTNNKIQGIVVKKEYFEHVKENKCRIYVRILKLKYSGKLIEFEGVDAAGKTTYINMLKEYLENNNQKVKVFDFPQYYTYIGKLIKSYLNDEIQISSNEVLNVLFACDRVSVQKDIENLLYEGYIVILNRYTYSNLYQIANYKNKEQKIKELEKLEFEDLNIMIPDEVIYLTLNINEVIKRIEHRNNKDKNEDDHQLLINANKLYLDIATKYNWKIINEDGLSIKEVFNILKEKLNL